MKLTVTIDQNCTEEIKIFAHERNELIDKIEDMLKQEEVRFVGFFGGEIFPLEPDDVFCFFAENNKCFALLENKKLEVKQRLYKIEAALPREFVKINQSCIANLSKIEKFEATIGGTLKVVFKNGHTDYVSRRNLKSIKERLGIK